MFLNISEHLLTQGFCVRFHAEGTSMRPAIEHGDVITVGPVDPAAIAPGDIVLYRRLDRPVAITRCAEPTIAAKLSHRIARIRRVATALLQDSATKCAASQRARWMRAS